MAIVLFSALLQFRPPYRTYLIVYQVGYKAIRVIEASPNNYTQDVCVGTYLPTNIVSIDDLYHLPPATFPDHYTLRVTHRAYTAPRQRSTGNHMACTNP